MTHRIKPEWNVNFLSPTSLPGPTQKESIAPSISVNNSEPSDWESFLESTGGSVSTPSQSREVLDAADDPSSAYIIDDSPPLSRTLEEQLEGAFKTLLEPSIATPFTLYPKLTQMTGGLRPHEFTILCGQTGSGKTTLMAGISVDLVLQKVPHFVASVETGANDFAIRVMSVLAARDWNSGERLPLEDAEAFMSSEHGNTVRSKHLHLSQYDNRVAIERLLHELAWHHKHNACKVAIIDNLNFFLEVTSADDEKREMDRVIHELVIFCKRVPMHVIMVMHPKKTLTGRVESVDDVRGSSLANQEASNIIFWNRPHPDRIKQGLCDFTDRELTIAKMRRRGRYVGQTLIFAQIEGVKYVERGIVK